MVYDCLFIDVALFQSPLLLEQSLRNLQDESRVTGDKILVDICVDDCIHISGDECQRHPPELGGLMKVSQH